MLNDLGEAGIEGYCNNDGITMKVPDDSVRIDIDYTGTIYVYEENPYVACKIEKSGRAICYNS